MICKNNRRRIVFGKIKKIIKYLECLTVDVIKYILRLLSNYLFHIAIVNVFFFSILRRVHFNTRTAITKVFHFLNLT